MRSEKERAATRDYNRRWQQANPERWRAIKRRCNRKNRRRYNLVEIVWRARNKDRVRLYGMRRVLRTYGLTIDDYLKMRALQHEKCALCGTPATQFKKRLSVDHCHKTKRVRALLCSRCNTGLGLFLDDRRLLHAAIRYLDKHARRK